MNLKNIVYRIYHILEILEEHTDITIYAFFYKLLARALLELEVVPIRGTMTEEEGRTVTSTTSLTSRATND